ncbi:MAG TPA: hypothetical protein VGK52_04315 [Polyangia bacterium]|jgi:hypothetical protein
MRRVATTALLALGLTACGKVQGFGGPAPPLVSFDVTFTGDLAALRPPGIQAEQQLRVALVWGDQWLTEPFCVLKAESPDAAAVIAAGCRDPFGFVPANVAASVPLALDGPTTLTLEQLPSADLLVGDVTSRVAYGSFVVFDDRGGNGAGNGTLDLSQPQRAASGRGDRGGGPNGDNVADALDVIYGASFVTMTMPDRRVAYREGAFTPTAFYPRGGCSAPRPGFSVVGAGGFSMAPDLASALAGALPAERSCFDSAPDDTVTAIAAQAPAHVEEVGCDERTADSSTRYREPPESAPDFGGRVMACAHLPSFDTGGMGTPSTLIQLVLSGHASDHCKGLTHYTLRGCRESVTCSVPDWDFTATPPAWWPCH